MPGATKIEIAETEETLKALLLKVEKAEQKEKVQALYWLKTKTFDNLEELREAVEKSLGKLSKEIVASLTGWKFILDALSVADI